MTEPHSEPTPSWPGPIQAVTLFVKNLDTARHFYQRVFDKPIFFEDQDSVVFQFEQTLINLLKISAAAELVGPALVDSQKTMAQSVFTLGVADVDAVCQNLEKLGVQLLNGPMDRPWGVRTASFQDPDGYIWEIAK